MTEIRCDRDPVGRRLIVHRQSRTASRAVIAAMAQRTPPHRLVLGGAGFDAVVTTLESALDDIRASAVLSRGADFPAA